MQILKITMTLELPDGMEIKGAAEESDRSRGGAAAAPQDHVDEARSSRMKAAWTPERRAAQRQRLLKRIKDGTFIQPWQKSHGANADSSRTQRADRRLGEAAAQHANPQEEVTKDSIIGDCHYCGEPVKHKDWKMNPKGKNFHKKCLAKKEKENEKAGVIA